MSSVDWDEIYANLKPVEPPEKINAYKVVYIKNNFFVERLLRQVFAFFFSLD